MFRIILLKLFLVLFQILVRSNIMAYAIAISCGALAILLTILWRKLGGKRITFQEHYSHDNGRPIGVIEKWLTHGHDAAGSLSLASTLVLRSKKPITGSVVRKAMEVLMKRHPMLRMCTKKNQDGDYLLQKMTNVHVDLRELDTTNWKTVMEESLLEKFDGENGPLWRVTFLPNARYEPVTEGDFPDITSYPHECICIFGFHHITVDGPSYSRMFAEFITYLNKLINNEEPEVTSMLMLPPVDLYMDKVMQPKWYHHVIQLVLEILYIIPGFPAFMISMILGEGNAFTRKHGVEIQRNPLIQPRTKIIPVEFTKVETLIFLKKCKEHQTTVQGAAQIVAGVAMVNILEEQQCEVIDSYVTVNVRPFLKSIVPDDYAGAYCYGLQCKNLVVSSPDAAKFWSMARQASGDLHARLKNNTHMKMWPMMKCLSPVVTRMMDEVGLDTKDDTFDQRDRQLVAFTNLGYAKFLDGSPGDDVILRARFGCSARHQLGTIFGNNIVTFNGKMFWTVIHFSNITNDATAQKYADLVKGTILEAIKDINY